MPIVTLTVRKPKSAEFKSRILEAVHGALVDIGVNPSDRFHRVLELAPEDFQYDARFTEDFVLVEILLGVGRSVKLKKAVSAGILERLAPHGFDPENLMLVFQDVAWENWSPAGGRFPNN